MLDLPFSLNPEKMYLSNGAKNPDAFRLGDVSDPLYLALCFNVFAYCFC